MARPRQLPSGNWRIRWLDEHGERHSDVFDRKDDAQFMLNKHELEVKEIKRGLRVPTVADKTFDELADHWLEYRATLKRSAKDDQSMIRCHLRPAFGRKRLRDLCADVSHFDRFALERQHLNKKTIANLLTLLISMLNLAKEMRWLVEAPRIKKPNVRMFSEEYDYLRTNDEIRRLLVAAQELGDDVHALYATAIFSGMRQGEIAGLMWADIDFERRLIVVQRSFDGPTKSGDVRYVPIMDRLLPILRAWRLRSKGTRVFTNTASNMFCPSARIFQEGLHAMLESAGFPKTEDAGRVRRYIVFHDLRHTFASQWVMNGGDIFKLQKILGHKSIAMTMRYAHLAPHAFAGDLGRFGPATSTEPATVLPLARVNA